MLSFFNFLGSFIASTLIILTAPSEYLNSYLTIYTISSFVFSLLAFFYFTYFASKRNIILVFLSLILTICLLFFAFGENNTLMVIYPGLLIFVDLIATQGHSVKSVNIFRLILLVTTLPFLIIPDSFFFNLEIRCSVILFILLYLISTAKSILKLVVNSPLKLLVGNYLFYNGILIIIPFLGLASNELRPWYISIQAGLVLILKYIDFKLRGIHAIPDKLTQLVYVASFMAPIPVLALYPNLKALLMFYIGYLGLIWTGRYVQKPLLVKIHKTTKVEVDPQ